MRTLLRPILIISIIVLLTGVQTVSPPFKSGDKDFIAYGKIYDPSMYPYLIRLIVNIDSRKFSVCSGSLISPLFVLTAAHCVHGKYKSTIKVFLSNNFDRSNNVHRIYEHPNYNPNYEMADVTLLQLKKPFLNVNKYAILSGHPDEFANDTELSCVVLGFGITENTQNIITNVGYITYAHVKFGPKACKLSSEPHIKTTWPDFLCSIPDEHMICPGDSGGPLICHGFQYGIASHGYNFINKNRTLIICGSSDIQTRHLFIYPYKKWISTTMKNSGNSLTSFYNYIVYFLLQQYYILFNYILYFKNSFCNLVYTL